MEGEWALNDQSTGLRKQFEVWAVVEPNECWGAGVYGCTPAKVLEVLLAATVPSGEAAEEDMKWNYAELYFRACPHMKDERNW